MKNMIKKAGFAAIALTYSMLGAFLVHAAGLQVTTIPVTQSQVTATTAVLQAAYTSSQTSVTTWFQYDDNSSLSSPVDTTPVGHTGTSGIFSQSISSLTPNTTYYFRGVAVDSSGISYGTPIYSFTTPAQTSQSSAPSISSVPASGVTATSGTLNGAFIANGSPTTTWFQYDDNSSLSSPTDTTPVNQTGSSGTFSTTISGLMPNTTYYFRAVGVNTAGITYGTPIYSFTTSSQGSQSAPSISTVPASGITSSTATLSGAFIANGSSTTTWFQYDDNSSLSSPVDTTPVNQGNTSGTFTTFVSGLNSNTTYYFRAVGVNANGITYGTPTYSFTTLSGNDNGGDVTAPVISNVTAVNIGTTNATINWNTNEGSTSQVEYGTNTNLGTMSILDNTYTTNHSFSIYGLSPSTTYYYRVRSRDNAGNSAQLGIYSFTTLSGNGGGGNGGGGGGSNYVIYPSVSTYAASSIVGSQALLNGYVNGQGYGATYYFQYGTTPTFGSVTPSTYSGSNGQNVSYTLTNLSSNTTYYFRLVAYNQFGTQYGGTLSFTAGVNGNNNGGNTSSLQAITLLGTNVTPTSVLLNAAGSQIGSGALTGYFEWGSTLSLGNTTTAQSLGTSSQVSWTSTLTGLSPNTYYYFRAVIQSTAGTSYGEFIAVHTKNSDGTGGEVTDIFDDGTTTSIPPVTIIPDQPPVITGITSGTDATLIIHRISAGDGTVVPGSQVDYAVEYQNISSGNITNSVVTIELPQRGSFVNTSAGIYNPATRTIDIPVGTLAREQHGQTMFSIQIDTQAYDGEIIPVIGQLTYRKGSVEKNILAYDVSSVKRSDLLPALAFLGIGAFPTSFMGILIAILLILIILYVLRQIISGDGKIARKNKVVHRKEMVHETVAPTPREVATMHIPDETEEEQYQHGEE